MDKYSADDNFSVLFQRSYCMAIPFHVRFPWRGNNACALPLATCLAVIATVAPAERLTEIRSKVLPYDSTISYAHAYHQTTDYLLGWRNGEMKLWMLKTGQDPESVKLPTPTKEERKSNDDYHVAEILTGDAISISKSRETTDGETHNLYDPVSHNWVRDAILYATQGGELHAFMHVGYGRSYHAILGRQDRWDWPPEIAQVLHRTNAYPILHNATNGYLAVERGPHSNVAHVFHDGRYRQMREFPARNQKNYLDFPDLFNDGQGYPRKISFTVFPGPFFHADQPAGGTSYTNETEINEAIRLIEEKSGLSGLSVRQIAGFDTETVFFALNGSDEGDVLAMLIYRPDADSLYSHGSFDVHQVKVMENETTQNLLVKPDGSVIHVGRGTSEEGYTRITHLDPELSVLASSVFPDDYQDFGGDEKEGFHDLRVRVLEDGTVSVTGAFHRDGVSRAMFKLLE